MRVVAILQARMSSTRLPGKVMLPLAGKPMVQNIIERVQRAKWVNEVVLAPPECDRAAFQDFNEVSYYAVGVDENDLVGRYLSVAIASEADLIVRVPCDNPCVDPAVIDQSIELYFDASDPISFFTSTVWEVKGVNVDGVGCEVFSISTLKWLDRKTQGQARWREHPHAYFYDRGLVPNEETDLRLDVNTRVDYAFVKRIYDHFEHNRFSSKAILKCPIVQNRLYGR